MTLKRTYGVAKVVEAIIEETVTSVEEDIYSEPYQNGRERGFALWVLPLDSLERRCVFVAENRNSDEIFTCFSKWSDWSMVSDEEYKKAIRFPVGQYTQAAGWILHSLLPSDFDVHGHRIWKD